MEYRAAPLVYIVDTPEMTEFCSQVLRQNCNRVSVETFTSPVEAMFAFNRAPVRPQVVATSLVSMQGMRLAEDVKDIDPSVRVLLMSGLEPDGIHKQLVSSRITPDSVLAKPFTPEDFTSKIQSLIE